MERLDKILASQGAGSRREVQKLIKKKSVTVNGGLITSPEFKVDPEKDEIKVNGQALVFKKHIYIMLNKPAGVLSATKDSSEKTVLDLLPEELRRKGLSPVGRLDKDTEGLMIISDDGEFAHKVISPKNHIFKRYFVKVDKNLTEYMISDFENGIIFKDGTKCLPAKLEIADKNTAFVEICEGKFHQIKKMFLSEGLKVEYLERIKIGGLELDSNLHRGKARELTFSEKNAIFIGK